MKSVTHITIAAALGTSLAACSPTPTPTSSSSISTDQAEKTTYTDAEALRMALDDEFKAEALYEAILAKHGDIRPFSNIINAERTHAQMAMDEMDRRGISYSSKNLYSGKIAAPGSKLEACQACVTGEIENIALYDRIIPSVQDAQTREVLLRLQAASRDRHLPAFQRCVDRGGRMGNGPGGGRHGN